uniref:(northern house mosquito) hypothetical protein n=1 Tax=Culex pipiens TaxID=7175 RepID=A0A8D8AJE7_CULPI
MKKQSGRVLSCDHLQMEQRSTLKPFSFHRTKLNFCSSATIQTCHKHKLHQGRHSTAFRTIIIIMLPLEIGLLGQTTDEVHAHTRHSAKAKTAAMTDSRGHETPSFFNFAHRPR